MYASGSSQNKRARRTRIRRASRSANNKSLNITSNTSLKSISEILVELWQDQEPGWAVIRAYRAGSLRGHDQLWFRSDEITVKALERWLTKHRAWHVEFCPVTFEQNWSHLDWNLFERGRWNARLGEYDTINRRECLSYLEYGPVERSEKLGREPDMVIEDKGIWFTDFPSYIDYEARDGLFVWLPRQQLSAGELIKLYLPAVRRDLKHYGADRSTIIWRIGKECVRKGMRDPDDIKTVIRASAAFQSRLEERGERQAERGLDSDVRKLLREAP